MNIESGNVGYFQSGGTIPKGRNRIHEFDPSTFHGTRAVLGSIFEPGVPTAQGVQHSGKELCPSLRSPKSVSPKCNKDA